MMTQQFNRFKDAPWFSEKGERILIGGAGGIGSWLTFLLTRAGFSPILYDFDIIEEHNIGGQLFKKEDIGRYKVAAVSSIIRSFCEQDINTFTVAVDESTPTHYFVFSAFDNMKARKDLFNVWKKSIDTSTVSPIFIDGRLEAEQLQIFCVTPDRIQEYEEKHLFDDSEVEDAPCTMRQTSHTAAMIASHMTAFFTNHLTNIYERELIRTVPFYYEYFIPMSLTEEIDSLTPVLSINDLKDVKEIESLEEDVTRNEFENDVQRLAENYDSNINIVESNETSTEEV